jgi:hypothetical protein
MRNLIAECNNKGFFRRCAPRQGRSAFGTAAATRAIYAIRNLQIHCSNLRRLKDRSLAQDTLRTVIDFNVQVGKGAFAERAQLRQFGTGRALY